MKYLIIILLSIAPAILNAQTLLYPGEIPADSTFTDYNDGNQWAYITRNGITVGLTCYKDKDIYGKYYKIEVMIHNARQEKITFDPERVSAYVNKKDKTINLQVFTSEEYQKKMKRLQNLSLFSIGFSSSYSYPNQNYSNVSDAIDAFALEQFYKQDRDIRKEGYLKKHTIYSGETLVGYMNIKRKKGIYLEIRVPLYGYIYRFSWKI